VVVGGDVSASASTDPDELAWFNYTDYEHNALRLVRLGLSTDIHLGPRVSILGQLLTENGDRLRVHALYVRVKPWPDRGFDIQAGRIPPTFGAFARRNYSSGTDNPVIGYPLAYQYLTSLRADAVPADADDLLQNRGNGWRPSFLVGSSAVSTGLPLVTAFEWDTGVQGRFVGGPAEISASITAGTLSEPRVRDNNRGKQVAARLAVRPIVGLIVGLSAARGVYLADSVKASLPADFSQGDFIQRAWGFDAEYSRDHWLVRGETVVSEWWLPAVRAPVIDHALRAWAMSMEGRYAFWPGAFAAGRYDHLGFNRLQGSRDTLAWDAPVTRIEVGGGYYFQRNLVGKVTYQHNRREAGPLRRLGVWAGQLLFWF
jgi:hypothetical protein